MFLSSYGKLDSDPPLHTLNAHPLWPSQSNGMQSPAEQEPGRQTSSEEATPSPVAAEDTAEALASEASCLSLSEIQPKVKGRLGLTRVAIAAVAATAMVFSAIKGEHVLVFHSCLAGSM